MSWFSKKKVPLPTNPVESPAPDTSRDLWRKARLDIIALPLGRADRETYLHQIDGEYFRLLHPRPEGLADRMAPVIAEAQAVADAHPHQD